MEVLHCCCLQVALLLPAGCTTAAGLQPQSVRSMLHAVHQLVQPAYHDRSERGPW
jgi:hypothetical protein